MRRFWCYVKRDAACSSTALNFALSLLGLDSCWGVDNDNRPSASLLSVCFAARYGAPFVLAHKRFRNLVKQFPSHLGCTLGERKVSLFFEAGVVRLVAKWLFCLFSSRTTDSVKEWRRFHLLSFLLFFVSLSLLLRRRICFARHRGRLRYLDIKDKQNIEPFSRAFRVLKVLFSSLCSVLFAALQVVRPDETRPFLYSSMWSFLPVTKSSGST